MSKSLGNVIDPLHIIDGVSLETLKEGLRASNLAKAEVYRSLTVMEKEYPEGIAACGTDSLRFALINYTQQTRQINLDVASVVLTTHFGNKFWQLMRFSLSRFDAACHRFDIAPSASLPSDPTNISLVNRYVLSRLAAAVEQCQAGMEQYKLYEATDAVRKFVVEDLCDVYVEFSKPVLQDGNTEKAKEKKTTLDILGTCLDVSLKLTHPFMPFVTEELWQTLQPYTNAGKSNTSSPPSLMLASFPSKANFSHWRDETVEKDFKHLHSLIDHLYSIDHIFGLTCVHTIILSIIHASRSLRQSNRVSKTRELPFVVWSDDPAALALEGPLRRYTDEIKRFARASELRMVDATKHYDAAILGASAVKVITPNLHVYTPMSAILSAALVTDEQVTLLQKKLERTERELEQVRARMGNEDYERRVPEIVREKD
ncbi:hypothetical protein BC938DRAFT_480372, partial [Jimgerdemannia flammicorona]